MMRHLAITHLSGRKRYLKIMDLGSIEFISNTTSVTTMSLVDLGKRLLEAAKQGKTDDVRSLMSNGAPFTTDWLGTSPLHFASQNGHVATAEVLLRAGISRDARTKVERTPLHVAAQEGHMDIVDLLVRNGADVDAKDMLRNTPMHWSVENGHADIVQYLLLHGAEPASYNKFEKTALDIALCNGRGDIVDLLQSQMEALAVNEPQIVEEVQEMTGEIITDGDTGSQNGTELATLAALATANSDGTIHLSDAETLKWLESHGIQMVSVDNTTLVGNTVANGQQLALTEAGKLALGEALDKNPQDDLEVTLDTSDMETADPHSFVVNLHTTEGEEISTDIDYADHVSKQELCELEDDEGNYVIEEDGVVDIGNELSIKLEHDIDDEEI